MSTDTEADVAEESPDDAAERVAELEARIEQLEAESGNAAVAERDQKSMVIIATQGTLDMAYPPLILASTAAAFDWDVTVFHTFWGLDILHEQRSSDLKLSAVGNPNMPVPNAVGALPGMDRLATTMMERRIADNDVATIGELLETSLEMGVDLQACQMTMDLMDYDDDAFHDGVTVGVGAATALSQMAEADVQLLV
ncbi:DsrE/DsrF/DrsH-like family protein [Halobaculum sp. EA56]|uniref:DsrE/DsrF/DrsH-like family protein n=1 Tax=Halobaculum sp. EA56 TaxID=3421648 RepID=UPI003EBB0491